MVSEPQQNEPDEALALLAAEYQDEDRGIQLREVAGGWRLFTHPVGNRVTPSAVEFECLSN